MQVENLNLLIKDNMYMITTIAKKYTNEAIELDDLIQEGVIALVQASKKFSSSFNVPFTVYAKTWINRHIQRMAEKEAAMQIPAHTLRAYNKITSAYRNLEQLKQAPPTESEIAVECDMPEAQIRNTLSLVGRAQNIISLNLLVNSDDSEDEIMDFIPSETQDATEIIQEKAMKKDLHSLLARLKDREREIIFMHMGFESEPMTFEEIGNVLGISRQRVYQLEQRAMRKLGCAKNKAILIQYL